MGLEQNYFFSRLSPETLKFLQTITQTRCYTKGNILFYAGDFPKMLHVIDSGIVKIFKHDPSGNEVHITFFHPTDMIAEMAHFESIPYPATARCESDVRIFEIPFDAFKNRFMEDQHLAFQIIRSLTGKIKQLEGMIHRSLIDDAQTRLARFILDNEATLPSLTQRQIAELLTVTPETISRILRRFKANGWIRIDNKKLYLSDRVGLSRFISKL